MSHRRLASVVIFRMQKSEMLAEFAFYNVKTPKTSIRDSFEFVSSEWLDIWHIDI